MHDAGQGRGIVAMGGEGFPREADALLPLARIIPPLVIEPAAMFLKNLPAVPK
jgi:hypothetical protein